MTPLSIIAASLSLQTVYSLCKLQGQSKKCIWPNRGSYRIYSLEGGGGGGNSKRLAFM